MLADSRPKWAFDQHRRVKHQARCEFNKFVDSNRCPVCSKVFADRLRVIAHLSETRQRSKTLKRSCRESVVEGLVPELAPARVLELELEAKAQRGVARRAGHTRPVVPWHKRAAPLAELRPLAQRPAKRLRVKTAPVAVAWVWTEPHKKARVEKTAS